MRSLKLLDTEQPVGARPRTEREGVPLTDGDESPTVIVGSQVYSDAFEVSPGRAYRPFPSRPEKRIFVFAPVLVGPLQHLCLEFRDDVRMLVADVCLFPGIDGRVEQLAIGRSPGPHARMIRSNELPAIGSNRALGGVEPVIDDDAVTPVGLGVRYDGAQRAALPRVGRLQACVIGDSRCEVDVCDEMVPDYRGRTRCRLAA